MVLLVIDTQKGITDERLFAFEQFRKNVRSLIEAARANGREVIFVQHDDGPGSGFSLGDDDYAIFEEFAPKDSEKVFTKTVNSALHPSTGLASYLKSKNVHRIMVVGLQTNFCIDSTIRTGFDLGFEMIVPAYANSTFDNDFMDKEKSYHYYNDFLWPERFAKCLPLEEALLLLRK